MVPTQMRSLVVENICYIVRKIGYMAMSIVLRLCIYDLCNWYYILTFLFILI